MRRPAIGKVLLVPEHRESKKSNGGHLGPVRILGSSTQRDKTGEASHSTTRKWAKKWSPDGCSPRHATRATSRRGSIVRAVPRHRNPPPAANKPATDTHTYEYLAQAFSEIELRVAIDVIESAISEGRRHVDLEALKRVLAKLTAARNWKKRTAS